METEKFAESAKGFTKSPLGIIALFIVLVYGFASLVVGAISVGFSKEASEASATLLQHLTPLIYFMVFFPVIVFFGFLWLVANHHNKLYGPSDFKNEDNFLKTLMPTIVSIAAAEARQPGNKDGLPEYRVKEIMNKVSNAARKMQAEPSRKHVLWVDDNPENNINERHALEAQGIEFTLAKSTDEALTLTQNRQFAAIISDMRRKEGAQEGYTLLEKLTESGNKIPYVIYAGTGSAEQKQLAKDKGATGLTNRADELFELIIGAVSNKP